MTIPIASIHSFDRLRSDLGDVEDLAQNIEQNGLIQPIILSRSGDNYTLVAGGRRLAALSHLGVTVLHHGITSTPGKYGFVFASDLPLDVRREIELDENLKRKDMSWKERIKGYCELHRLWSKRAILAGQPWTQQYTADRIGFSRTLVTDALTIEPIMDEPAFAECESLTDAVKIRWKQKQDAAMAELARRTMPAQLAEVIDDEDDLPSTGIDVVSLVAPDSKPLFVNVPLSRMLIKGDSARDVLPHFPDYSVDHCITDWPYAIDMDSLDQAGTGIKDIDRVAATHDVVENLDLQRLIVPQIFRVLKDGGFFVTWMDIMHWNSTYNLLVSAGFGVQRWPITWHKLHTCKNQMAHVNFTKNTEIAIVARKGKCTLVTPQSSSVIACERDPHSSNPFAKPFELWKFIIEAVSIQGQTILDPFAGEGSCPVSALKLGRQVLAIEKDETHWPYLVNNVSDYYRTAFPSCTFS